MKHDATLTIITNALYKAAKPLLRDFSEVDRLQISKKGTANFVSNADIRTEAMLVEAFTHARKDWAILTEESGLIGKPDAQTRFVIDPIDGTTNFIHAIPYFCMSVAVEALQPDGSYLTELGVVFDPLHEELFIAQRGGGGTRNREKLRVSQRETDWLVSTSAPRLARHRIEEVEAAIDAVARSGATVRCSGAAALDLAYVAAGRYDGIWYHRLQHWDMAAGRLLVEEAGGLISPLYDAAGAAIDGSVLASNKLIHGSLQQMLGKAAGCATAVTAVG